MVAGAPRGVEGRAGGRPRRTVMLTGAPFRGTGVLGWARPGAGHGHAGAMPEATGRAGGGDREGGEVLPCPWSAAPGSRSRLDFAAPGGCPGRRRGRPAELRRGDGAWT